MLNLYNVVNYILQTWEKRKEGTGMRHNRENWIGMICRFLETSFIEQTNWSLVGTYYLQSNTKLGTGNAIVNKKKYTSHSPFPHRHSGESYQTVKRGDYSMEVGRRCQDGKVQCAEGPLTQLQNQEMRGKHLSCQLLAQHLWCFFESQEIITLYICLP